MRHTTTTADEAQSANCRKVMHDGIARYDRAIVNMHVPAEQNAVDQNHVIEDPAVVRDMTIGHEQIVVADAGDSVFLLGTTIDGDSFAKTIVVADRDFRIGILPTDILRIAPDHGIRPEAVVASDRRATNDHDMTLQMRAIAECDVRTDDAKRPNHNAASYPGSRINLRHRGNSCFHEGSS